MLKATNLFDTTQLAAMMRSAASSPSEDQDDDERCPTCNDHPFVCDCDG